MHYLRFILILLFYCHLGINHLNAQEIVINEIMSNNENSISDESGYFPDWIELYNRGQNTIDLKNYYLSDDENDLKKWRFPNIELASEKFLLIFASGKEYDEIDNLHTNFKLSSKGENLILSDSQGAIIDKFDPVELQEDQSFGRLPDGSDNKINLPTSSPEATNNNSNKLLFSHEPGLYDAPFELTVNSYLEDTIFYTLDGSEPTPKSFVLDSSLALKNISHKPNFWSEIPTTPTQEYLTYKTWEPPKTKVDKATILRCASYKNDVKTSETYTRSYLILEDVFNRYNMPIISLITEGDNFFDEGHGIYVPGNQYDADNAEWTGNYFTDEIESERPIHIEYFEPNGNLGFSQNAGVRIHGGKTRHAAQKSLKLYARKEYGEKYFNYPLMPQNGVQKYKRFLLQTTMAAWGGDIVVKDILAHEIVKDFNIERMDYKPVVVFLNGEYWGIHHIRDRVDEDYLAYTTGLDVNSIEIDRKGNTHFFSLIDYFKDHLPIDNAALMHIATKMDIDGFIDYQIAQMFLNNYDWPANNNRHWKPKSEDGKWRWLFFDIDAGFGDYTYNMLEHNTNSDSTITWPNAPSFTFFFRSLIENDKFLDQFLTRYKELLENDFRPDITKEKLFAIIEAYEAEMPHHIERWNFPNSMNIWLDDIDTNIIDFLENRPCTIVENINDFFSLENFQVACKDTLEDNTFSSPKSNIQVSPNPSNGIFSIHQNNPNSRLIQVEVINSIGQNVFQKSSIILKGKSKHQVDLSHLNTGIYYLKIVEMNTVSTIPIFIST